MTQNSSSPNGANATDDSKTDDSKNASLGELFSRLASDTSTLVRQEVALARAEVGQTVSKIAKVAIMLVLAGVMAFLAIIVLLAAAVIALGDKIGSYAYSSLIIGVGLLLLAGVFALIGKSKLKGGLAPTQTIETLRDDAQWLKEQVKH